MMALAVMRIRSLFLLLAQRELERLYSGGQNKVGQVLLRNLAKIELSKPGLL
jgi:hypothetical protein